MTKFAELGVTCRRTFKTTSVSINQRLERGLESLDRYDDPAADLYEKKTTQLELTLPQACPIRASFCKEGISRKLIKLFKKELQTGDPVFDDAVYITTDTTDATAAWLANETVRAAILELIQAEATIEVSGTIVSAMVQTHDDGDDPAVVRVVQSLVTISA
jgi:hypothetical protein